LNRHRLYTETARECGIAFGEAVSISSGPSRRRIGGRVESGLGGRADGKSQTARAAFPLLGRKNPFTTFDNNIEAVQNQWQQNAGIPCTSSDQVSESGKFGTKENHVRICETAVGRVGFEPT